MSIPDYSAIVRGVSGKIISWTDTTGGFHGSHIIDVSKISPATERELRPSDTLINQPIYGVEPKIDAVFVMTIAILASVLLVCGCSIVCLFTDSDEPIRIPVVQEIDLPENQPWSEFDAKTYLKETP